jgi:hypothetical protein
MSEGFSRRVFLGNSLAIGGGLLLGGCDSGAAIGELVEGQGPLGQDCR